MNPAEINKILLAVIALGIAWRVAEWIQLRSVAAKREKAAKLEAAAFFQELMEGSRRDNLAIANDHLARRRKELDLVDATPQGAEPHTAAPAFSPEAAK